MFLLNKNDKRNSTKKKIGEEHDENALLSSVFFMFPGDCWLPSIVLLVLCASSLDTFRS